MRCGQGRVALKTAEHADKRREGGIDADDDERGKRGKTLLDCSHERRGQRGPLPLEKHPLQVSLGAGDRDDGAKRG